MFKTINAAHNALKAAAATALAGVSGFLLEKYKSPNMSTMIIVAGLIFIANAFFIYTLTSLIDSTRFLRRIVLGNDYLEGFWVQKIKSSSKELSQAPHYTIIEITFEKARYKLSGISFRADEPNYTATFQSDISTYAENKLKYPFKGTTLEKDIKKAKNVFSGYTSLTFVQINNSPPTSFVGVVHSNVRTIPVLVEGFKIDNFIDPQSSSGRAALIALIDKTYGVPN